MTEVEIAYWWHLVENVFKERVEIPVPFKASGWVIIIYNKYLLFKLCTFTYKVDFNGIIYFLFIFSEYLLATE